MKKPEVQNSCSKNSLPIGGELRTFLHAWLKLAEKAHDEKQYFPADINWAIGGRATEVLAWLDVSAESIDYNVAKAIRRIGTMDRVNLGYPSGYFHQYRYGLLAQELGNKTWIPGNNRLDNRGEAAQEYYLRYGEEPYFV